MLYSSRLHPDYVPSGKTSDLALVQVDRRVKFRKGLISPICLPHKNFNDISTRTDPELKAYVAGSNRMYKIQLLLRINHFVQKNMFLDIDIILLILQVGVNFLVTRKSLTVSLA